ncbi:phosphotransferase enzyme family protein [Nocardioides kongjuensis]|uniref:Ser/Thr protein kinase RdoA (MazF antagonist) n=1 Tax=Nocardioides kongjuensis TaxID=349522 RepID=A0A852RJ11_9ACTN|nr:Ser/Thr protein kinase RdoA (MazF antagonist) [Nocardioides kongjuensis]
MSFYTLPDREQAAALARLADVAGASWAGGLHRLELVKYRENAVFSAELATGRRVAVRVHRHAYHSPAAVISELEWMRSLHDVDGFTVPPVVSAADGSLVVEAAHPGVPEPRQVTVLGWLSGRPAGTSEAGVDLAEGDAVRLFADAGRLAARLHRHTATWVLPQGFTRPAWDADALVGEHPRWGRFWEYGALTDAERDLLVRARDRARADLLALGRHDGYGLIHADLVPENILVDGGELQLIDFDDAGHGWYLFELATALYFHLDQSCFDALRAALLSGYRSERDLAADDERLLPLFLYLRGTTYLGWVQSRPETGTAKEFGPALRALACRAAEDYLTAASPVPTPRRQPSP